MNTITSNHEDCITSCNKLLRGERSAVETYNKALEKFETQPQIGELRRIRDEHQKSVTELEQQVISMGGTPETGSGAWGAFANLVQGAANLFGKESAIGSLENGEKAGLEDYTDALKSRELLPAARSLYTDKLIPRIESHLVTLGRLEERAQ